jgi:hypothetical protein
MPCSVCNHPERQAIDQALLSRSATLAGLSQKYNLSQSALHRHKQHLLKKMPQTRNRFQDILREGCLFILNSFLESIMRVTQTAGAEGNARLVLQAVRQGTGIIKFMHKQDFPLEPDTVYRLLSSPEWADQGSLLPSDPKFFLGSHQALADRLFSSCPEPGSEQDMALGEGLGDGAPLADPADLNPELLQNLFTALTQSLGLPGCETHPQKREKGGKKPKKAFNANNNSKQYQKDILHKENAGKSPRNREGCHHKPVTANPNLFHGTQNSELETPGWLRAIDEGKLDFDTLHAIGAGRPINLDLFRNSVSA